MRLLEDAVVDSGLTVDVRSAGGGVFRATVRDSRFRNEVGHVDMGKDDAGRLMRIEGAVLDPGYQHRGIGPALYLRLDRWAAGRFGYRLASDIALSPDAERLWSGMARRGLARHVDDARIQARYYVMEMVSMPVKSVWEALAGRPNPIRGGVGDALGPDDVDPEELSMGVEDEKEHSPDPDVAADVAFDHLAQDPLYYRHHSESAWHAAERALRG